MVSMTLEGWRTAGFDSAGAATGFAVVKAASGFDGGKAVPIDGVGASAGDDIDTGDFGEVNRSSPELSKT